MSEGQFGKYCGNGTPGRVAFDLMAEISKSKSTFLGEDGLLDLYAKCLQATSGRRVVK